MAPAPGIQSSSPEKVDIALLSIKGHDYYKDDFAPPVEEVTEIDPRDKVGEASRKMFAQRAKDAEPLLLVCYKELL